MDLKGGNTTTDLRLDRVYELDLNSLKFLVARSIETLRTHAYPRSYTWDVGVWLDQGQEGACVGFGFAHELAARPVPVAGLTNDYARTQIYWEAQKIDEWGGGSYPGAVPVYEGTSVLSGAKICTQLGFFSRYEWAMDAREIADGIGYTGPAVLGLPWYQGMFSTDANGWIHRSGQLAGGHCVAAIGVKIVYKTWVSRLFSRKWDNVDFDRSYVTLHNSWSQSWGVNGRARLSLRDLDALLAEQGDACFPVRTTKVAV